MAIEKQIEIIKRVQALQMKLEDDFHKKLPVIFKDLSKQVIELTNDLPLDPKERAKNIRSIIDLKTQIGDVVATNPAYVAEVAALIDGFKDLKKLSDLYFSELIDGFSAKELLYKEILNANIVVTKDALLGAGIRSNFSNAITEVLKANASGVTNRTQLQGILKTFIEGTPEQAPFLNRYVKQTTSDAVMTFSRDYNNTISEDLNLQYYFYSGTLINDSRQFCQARAGRYFKKSVVENWANLGKWNGRKPNTTAITIFSFLGGWGCLHTLWPVTKLQYQLAEKKGIAGLK